MATKIAENGKLEEAYRLVQEHQQQDRQVRIDAFIAEYKELCQKYGLELVAGVLVKDIKS